MRKFIKLFENHSQYEEFTGTTEFILPNVSHCEQEGDVHYNPYIKVTGVTLNKSELSIAEGDTDTLVATVLPNNASNKNVIWRSSDESVATVDSNGVVSGVGVGNANITVTTVDGGFTAQCVTNVKSYKAITYAASAKLSETTSTSTAGLHTNVFSGTSGQQLSIVSHTFENGIGTIIFNNDVKDIGVQAFYECRELTSIDIPDSVTSIGASAFTYCVSLTSVDIPDNVTSINYGTFQYCYSLTSIVIPDSVTSIGYMAFQRCSGLTSINIPSGVTSIGDSAFCQCYVLTSINIPDSVTSIGNYAFNSCGSLSSCTIGTGVTSIGGYAFEGCRSLTSIVSNATTAPSISYTTFYTIKTGGTLYVPVGSTGYGGVWMRTSTYYLGYYNWTKAEQ